MGEMLTTDQIEIIQTNSYEYVHDVTIIYTLVVEKIIDSIV